METFLEYETMFCEPPPGHVFVESLAEIDPRKVAEVVLGSRDKKQRLCDPFFRALSETYSAISLGNHPSFRDLFAKTTLQTITIYRDPIVDNDASLSDEFTPIYGTSITLVSAWQTA